MANIKGSDEKGLHFRQGEKVSLMAINEGLFGIGISPWFVTHGL